LTVRLLYVFLFHKCHSFDLATWSQVGDILLAGGNPYHLTHFLNWPPAWMQFIFLFKKISLVTQWPFDDVVRGFLILAETMLALVLYAASIRYAPSRCAGLIIIAGIALNPVSVFQVCQHCNFDVLAGFWILLAVYMLLRFQEHHDSRFWLCACLAVGLGALTKTVPLCLTPLLLLSLRKLRFLERILGAVLLLGPILLALSIVYVLGPDDIKSAVLGYRSIPGTFGFTGLFAIGDADHLLAVWPRVFEIIYGSGWLLLGAWLLVKDSFEPRKIVTIAAALLVAIAALGPGYGLQYIYWFLPLLVLLHALAGRRMRFFLLTLYGVAAVSYAVEYAFNYKTYGAFVLELYQTKCLLKFGGNLASPAWETLLTLPLWLLYCLFVFQAVVKIGGEMIHDFQARWRRTHWCHPSKPRGRKPAPLFR
jgi:hypothetical protein